MNDITQTLVRAVLKIGSGYFIGYCTAKGIADANTAQVAAAGLVALGSIVWGVLHRKPTTANNPASAKS